MDKCGIFVPQQTYLNNLTHWRNNSTDHADNLVRREVNYSFDTKNNNEKVVQISNF